MRLPNPERAVVDIAKLTDYCLNPKHEDGKKAKVFAAPGLSRNDGEWLRSHLLDIAHEEAVFAGESRFGRLYMIDFRLETPRGAAVVRSGWIVRTGEDFARLTTCFVLKRSRKDEMTHIPLLAPVALVVDLPEQQLTRGQMGTVVEYLRCGNEEAVLVEFSDEDGQAYAMANVRPEQLIVLHRRETEAA
jgi:hypothetical protein